MKIYINNNQVAEIPERNATIRIEMDDSNEIEMEVEQFVWLMTEAELPTE